jgi:hypothetical protein
MAVWLVLNASYAFRCCYLLVDDAIQMSQQPVNVIASVVMNHRCPDNTVLGSGSQCIDTASGVEVVRPYCNFVAQ